MKATKPNFLLIGSGCFVLAMQYIFQRVDYFNFLCAFFSDGCYRYPYVTFVVNKTIRLLVNDAACFLIIIGFFKERRYLILSLYVLAIEVLLILPIYFLIKLSLEGPSEISSPLLSFIHRLIVNPTLMLLLIVALFYQRSKMKQVG